MDQGLVPATPAQPPVQFVPLTTGSGTSPTRQFLFVLFKWRELILGLFLAFTVAALVAAVLKPPVRSAMAKILLKPDRGVAISGLNAPTARVAHSPQVLQSEVELFRSRAVLLPVARALAEERARKEGQPVTESDVEGMLGLLRNGLLPTAVPDTNVIQVTYFARTAEEAVRTLRRIVDSYVEQHALASSGAADLLTFYEKEAGRAAAELRRAEDELKRWQEANNVVVIESQIQAQIEAVNTLERALQQAEAELEATRSRLVMLEAQSRALPARTVMGHERVPNPLIAKLRADLAEAEVALKDLTRNPVIDRLRGDVAAAEAALAEIDRDPLVTKLKAELVAAELQLKELLQRYTEKDRRVEEKKEQIETVRRELAAAQKNAEATARERLATLRRELAATERQAEREAQERIARIRRELAAAEAQPEIPGRETIGLNPLRESLERDTATARGQINALTAQRDTLRRQVREAASALADLREKRVTADRLARAVTVARDTYLAHARRLEEARVAAGLEKQQLADVAVIERPYATGETDLLRRVAMVVLAGLVGLGVGVAVAFGIEFFNQSLRTAEDVEFHLGLPVLAVVPAMPPARAALAARAVTAPPGPLDQR